MKNAALVHLVAHVLPGDAPCFAAMRHNKGREAVRLAERLAIALNDPKFVWNVAHAYVQAGSELPEPLVEYWFHQSFKPKNGS